MGTSEDAESDAMQKHTASLIKFMLKLLRLGHQIGCQLLQNIGKGGGLAVARQCRAFVRELSQVFGDIFDH